MKKTTILCVMAMLWPIKSKDKGVRSKEQGTNLKAKLILLMLVAVFSTPIFAQNTTLPKEQVVALKVGDKIPTSFWVQEHSIYQNGKISKQNLMQYKDKVLILDFWATWCGSCLKKLPYLESLQKSNADKLAIVMVNTQSTGDSLAQVKTIYEKLAIGVSFSLPTVYEDKYLKGLFPHYAVPHYIWINKQGQVTAITVGELLNDTNIYDAFKN